MMKKMNQMDIKKKLLLGFVVVALLGSISGIGSTILMKVIDVQYTSALENYGFSQGDIGKLLACLSQADGEVHDAISFSNKENQAKAIENYKMQMAKLPDYFAAVEKTNTTSEETGYYNSAYAAYQEYVTLAEELMEQGDTVDVKIIATVQERMVNELTPKYNEVYSTMADLLSVNVSTGTKLSDDLTTLVWVIIVAVIAVIVFCLLVSIMFGRKIAVAIASPVIACANRLKLLSEGDLNSAVPEVDTHDETKTLVEATKIIVDSLAMIIKDEGYLLKEMAEGNFNINSTATEYYKGDFHAILESLQEIKSSLSITLKEIQESSEQVAMASEQMAQGATALAEGSTDQASAVEELLATVSEVTDQVEQNSHESAEASKKAQDVGNQANESNQQMSEMITAMQRINDTSKQIVDIINSIDSIASQTNLLSLNAAIEAARAGEAGKGFAVVANEIRELASQSSQAANNTRQLIETSLREVESGTTIVNRTAESLNSVTEGIVGVVDLSNHVKDASEMQASSMEQINNGISQISSVIQNNSATAEESSATSEELSAQAETLNDLTSRFKFD
ncbi:MAG: methyl-accepting chemotaxis protein [Lachnospiraceae bacterium]